MTESSDVGSLPFCGDVEKFLEGAKRFEVYPEETPARYFKKLVIKGFVDKIEAGMDVPSYPQFRDMTSMFLEMVDGVEKVKRGYIETDRLSLKAGENEIPEVAVIRQNSQQIYEKTSKAFKAKVCITGPYTLSSLFVYRDKELFQRLADIGSRIVENNFFSKKYGRVELITLDEPLFGLKDDTLIDYGSEGRENLRKAWKSIFDKVQSKGARGCLHLHNTADELFWEVDSLVLIESHVDDALYRMEKTLKRLESTDKFLRASLCKANFDSLIRDKVVEPFKQELSESTTNQRIAEVWKRINQGKIDPTVFIEDVEQMKGRLRRVIDRFGTERILYAGPECGLRGFPNYESALECLKRVSLAVEGSL